MTTVAPESPVAPIAPQVPDQGRTISFQVPSLPEVKMPNKDLLGKAADSVLDKLSQGGYYVLKYGVGMPVGFAAELVGPATMWLPKVVVIAGGFGLDKWGGRRPDNRFFKLIKGLGEGLWKGGGLGLVSGIVADKLFPGSTQALADTIHKLDIPSIISTGKVGAEMGGETLGTFVGGQIDSGAAAVGNAVTENIVNPVTNFASAQGLQEAAKATGEQFNATFGAAAGEMANAAKDQAVAGANWAVSEAGGLANQAGAEAVKLGKYAAYDTLQGAQNLQNAVANSRDIQAGLLGAAAVATGGLAIKAKETREAREAQIPVVAPIPEVTPTAQEPTQPPVNPTPGGNP